MATGIHISLVSAFPPGRLSLNEYGFHLAKGLADRDDVSSVTVLADMLDAPAAELDLGPKVNVVRCWRFNDVRSPARIVKALRASGAEAALFNLQMATFGDAEIPAALGLLTPAIARLAGIPSGTIAHNILAGVDLEMTNLKGQRLRQWLVSSAGALVTRLMLRASYTTVTLQSYLDALQSLAPGADVSLVPHGTFETGPIVAAPLCERPLRIVTMGKFGTYKRLETLIKSFDFLRLHKEFADLELVIGGTDHPATPGYLDGLAASRRDDCGIRFAGYVAEEDIPAFFSQARLSVFDYAATTGSSGVLHQTASYGTVPVFPRIGDFVDVCRDEGISGLNFAPTNARDLAQVMADGLRDPRGLQKIANANQAAAAELPFSDVVGFHVNRLKAARKTGPADTMCAEVTSS